MLASFRGNNVAGDQRLHPKLFLFVNKAVMFRVTRAYIMYILEISNEILFSVYQLVYTFLSPTFFRGSGVYNFFWDRMNPKIS